MKIKLKKNIKYSICSCGLSKTLPFCDNEHRHYNSENNTNYKSLKVISECDTYISINSNCWTSNNKD